MDRPPEPVETAPPLGSWPRFYGVVIGWSIGVIALLTWFTACFHVTAS